MRLVQHDYDAELVLAGQFLDVLADAAMKRGKAGVRLQSHPDRDLAVEVAAVEGGGVGVGEAGASLGGSFLPGAQGTGLCATRVSGGQAGGVETFLERWAFATGLTTRKGISTLASRRLTRRVSSRE